MSVNLWVRRVDPLNAVQLDALMRLRLEGLRRSAASLLGDLGAEQTRTRRDWSCEANNGIWFLAWTAVEAVGLARVRENPGELPPHHLESMWVAPAARRNGVGAALVRAAEDYVVDAGASILGLWVVADNPAAVKLYEGLDYCRSLRQGRLPDGREETEYVKDLASPRRPGDRESVGVPGSGPRMGDAERTERVRS